MFVARESLILIHHATNVNYKTGKKTLGRHTVASTAVLSKRVFRGSRSDLPSFSNQNSFIMREQMDKNCQAEGILSNPQFKLILEKFLQSSTLEDYQSQLWQMFDFALASDDLDVLSAVDRSAMANTYYQLNQLLGLLTKIKSK